MKTTFKLVKMSAVLCAAVLTVTSTVQAGPGRAIQRIDTTPVRVSPGTGPKDLLPITTGPRANRGGADDPANHDINDDRGGANQPGDDRGGHRGHHRGRGR
jgi:hypothetical protein